ncbi:enkurin isoform X3 [Melopsittacus undulatus]|uniref:enkurin isoform X3 n=1 Tax=Melopsittacus undulatus TaxID=13146 RepID=UPI0012436D66|nr:enkurin isoform X3 [Melopsittacus undulatus]
MFGCPPPGGRFSASGRMVKKPYAEESISNLLPRLEEKPVKPPRYISIYRPSVKCEAEKNKAQWKTMGPAKVAVPSPKNFLQKHSKDPKLPARKKEQDPKKLPELSVPRRTDRPVMGIQSKKNFINTNAVAVITGLPKKPQPIYVDRRQGDKYLLETSGLVPKYIKKKGLKKNWEELNQEFQGLPVEMDTIPKKLNKEKLEIQMKQLEHDIDVIEKHKIIYIANE